MGCHGLGRGHDFWKYWRSFSSKDEMKPAFFSTKEAMTLDGSSKSPAKAIKITIYPDSEDKNEMRDLYAVWMADKYSTIAKSLRENKLPLNQKFWGRVSYIADPDAVAKGEAGKTEKYNGQATFPNIRVPVQAFASEQEAIAFTEANRPVDNPSNEYSAKAMASFSVEALEANGEEILKNLDEASRGIQWMDKPLPKSPSPPVTDEALVAHMEAVKKYIADIWKIEPDDIDTLSTKVVPF